MRKENGAEGGSSVSKVPAQDRSLVGTNTEANLRVSTTFVFQKIHEPIMCAIFPDM